MMKLEGKKWQIGYSVSKYDFQNSLREQLRSLKFPSKSILFYCEVFKKFVSSMPTKNDMRVEPHWINEAKGQY